MHSLLVCFALVGFWATTLARCNELNTSDGHADPWLIKRSPSFLPKFSKKLQRANKRFNESFNSDTSECDPSYEKLEYSSTSGGESNFSEGASFSDAMSRFSSYRSEEAIKGSKYDSEDDLTKQLDKMVLRRQREVGRHVNWDKTSWADDVNMKPYRKCYFPAPYYPVSKKQMQERKEDMENGEKLTLWSRLLNDLKGIPNIEDELINWEYGLVGHRYHFFSPLKEDGVISWIGPPTTEKMSFLPSKARESSMIGRDGYARFIDGFMHDYLAAWPRLIEPEYAYMQRAYDYQMEQAREKKEQRASKEELLEELEIAFDIRHCLQLTYRNLAAGYYQLITEINNRRAKRPDDYLPLSNYGFTTLID